MAKQFYTRLKTYFEQVGKILRGESATHINFNYTEIINKVNEIR